MKKSQLLEMLRDLPDAVDIDKLIYTLHFRREVERGVADADNGRVLSRQEFERRSDEWLK